MQETVARAPAAASSLRVSSAVVRVETSAAVAQGPDLEVPLSSGPGALKGIPYGTEMLLSCKKLIFSGYFSDALKHN